MAILFGRLANIGIPESIRFCRYNKSVINILLTTTFLNKI